MKVRLSSGVVAEVKEQRGSRLSVVVDGVVRVLFASSVEVVA